MARPKPDEGVIKAELLATAERLLARHGPSKVTVTDIAAECGMSQSNAYRYFPTKQALMEALATGWFSDVEERLENIAQSEGEPKAILRNLLLTQFSIKTNRYDQNPVLFLAYLDLATANPDAVAAHSARLTSLISSLVDQSQSARLRRKAGPTKAIQVFLDATLLIRDPWLIARFRSGLTKKRAGALIDLAICALQ